MQNLLCFHWTVHVLLQAAKRAAPIQIVAREPIGRFLVEQLGNMSTERVREGGCDVCRQQKPEPEEQGAVQTHPDLKERAGK